MSEPLRILHVFRAPLGGLFRHVLDLARGQSERGHAVGIVCDSTTGGPRADHALARLAPSLALGVTRFPMERRIGAADLSALARLSEIGRSARPDVLHGHGSKGGAFARLALTPATRSRPVVRGYTPHGGSFNYLPGTLPHRLYMRAEAILAGRTDVFLFESAFVKGRFVDAVGTPASPAPVVHNGLAESEFEPVRHRADALDLLYIGEWRFAKGIDTLVGALGLIRRENGRRLTLRIVGSGPDEAILRRSAAEEGVGDAIVFDGPRPIRQALESARVMVVPSKAESLPYVILEAAAASQPLVSTKVGGIPEIFGPLGQDLVPANDPRKLAGAILATCDQSMAERDAVAQKLRRYVRSGFRIDRMVDGVLSGYEHGRRRAVRAGA